MTMGVRMPAVDVKDGFACVFSTWVEAYFPFEQEMTLDEVSRLLKLDISRWTHSDKHKARACGLKSLPCVGSTLRIACCIAHSD